LLETTYILFPLIIIPWGFGPRLGGGPDLLPETLCLYFVVIIF